MRIAIHTLGTRGDVQPYIALAHGLIADGHEVQLAGPDQFTGFAAEYNVPYVPLPGEFLALMDTPEGKAAIAGGQGFSAGFKLLKYVRPLMRGLMDEEWAAARSFAPDIIVAHPKSIAAPHIAEALGCLYVLASPLPGFTPTSAFPSPMLPFASLGPLNKVSHALAIKGGDALFSKELGRWRSESLGLTGKRRNAPSGTLYAYSRHVVPVPPDWGADVLVSGYWFLDTGPWEMPDDLAAFLAAGEPPVYIGFGSVPGIHPRKMAADVVEALARSGKRGLMSSGGGALEADALPPSVHLIASAPHDKLLPLVSATIHHGGAGTTGASLRAGIPTAICPFFGDQPFWARRIAELGVGPAALDRKSLTAEALAAAIVAMDDPAMRRRATGIGSAIATEDGVAAAKRFLYARMPAKS